MRKEYFKVYIKDEYNNRCIAANCEVVCKTNTVTKTGAYIFRDIISQKLILPNYGYTYSDEEGALTYDNYNKNCYHKISRKYILDFLKGLEVSYIELYLKNIDTIENRIVEKSLVRKLDD